MGASASRPAGVVITLDALGTLYRFCQPVAVQYRDVARRCGLKTDIDLDRLQSSFKSAFKHHNKEYPNYGKLLLPNPEVWWTKLVERTFTEVVDGEKLPENLGSSLYDHFSSGAAYELYPDVAPFFEGIHALRKQYSDPEGPMVLTGVITNSDPRVRRVLNTLNLRVGSSSPVKKLSLEDTNGFASEQAERMARGASKNLRSPYYDLYNPINDIDVLVTSYDVGIEKPMTGIFQEAKVRAVPFPLSRAEQSEEDVSSVLTGAYQLVRNAYSLKGRTQDMKWIHVGDEYDKDYIGAEVAGMEALHLVRDGEGKRKTGVNTVSNLEEVAAIVGLMMEES